MEYWINKEHKHIFVSNARLSKKLSQMNDAELAMMHWAVTEWERAVVESRNAIAAAHECIEYERVYKQWRVSFADALLI